MTWHTEDGDRVLAGAEANAVKESIAVMLDDLSYCRANSLDVLSDYGVELFDELAWEQRLATLEKISRYLFTHTAETLELTAVNEAAVGAVFENIVQQIELEIDRELEEQDKSDRYFWRSLVIEAILETSRSKDEANAECEENNFEVPNLDSTELDQWRWFVEVLADRILWDRDFEMGHVLVDCPPENSVMLKQILGIDDNYYTAIADDPRSDEVDRMLDSIRAITSKKPR